MLEIVGGLAGDIVLGEQNGVPWLETAGEPYRFFGLPSAGKERREWLLLRNSLPAEISRRHWRIVKDFITRYLYPHLRPDLVPPGLASDNWAGFHGQHKDRVEDFPMLLGRPLPLHFKPEQDWTVINAGSFIGFGDLHLSRLLEKGRVLSVEADASAFALLEKNVEFNGLGNIRPAHRAVWSESGEMELETGESQANTLVKGILSAKRKQKVLASSIDDLVGEYALNRVDMVSLTLNGAEPEALAGAARTMEKHKPRFRVPGWYSREGRSIAEIASGMLADLGYEVFAGPHGNVLAVHPENAGD
jgi:FkbM family methyltransferase